MKTLYLSGLLAKGVFQCICIFSSADMTSAPFSIEAANLNLGDTSANPSDIYSKFYMGCYYLFRQLMV